MGNNRWAQTLVAVLLILIAGAVLAFSAETEVKVKVKGEKGQQQTATVDINGKVTAVKLDDLDDGETKTIVEGDTVIKVTRKGDALFVKTPDGDQEAEAHTVFVTGDDGEDRKICKRIVIRKSGGGEEDIEVIELPDIARIQAKVKAIQGRVRGEQMARVHERLLRVKEHRHELDEKMKALREKMKGLAKRLKKLNLEGQAEINDALLEHLERLQEIEIPPIPPIEIDEDIAFGPHGGHGHAWSWITADDDDDAETVVLTCDTDDVTMVLPKEAAAGRTIACPVCGKAMSESKSGKEAHKLIVRTKVKKVAKRPKP